MSKGNYFGVRTSKKHVRNDVPAVSLRQGLFTLVMALCVPGAILAQATAPNPQPLLSYGITGSDRETPERLRASTLMGPREVQELLLEIAKRPRDAPYIHSHLQGSRVTLADLESGGLLRRSGSAYAISFALLSQADVKQVRALAEAYGKEPS